MFKHPRGGESLGERTPRSSARPGVAHVKSCKFKTFLWAYYNWVHAISQIAYMNNPTIMTMYISLIKVNIIRRFFTIVGCIRSNSVFNDFFVIH